jgi:hypothetical protein
MISPQRSAAAPPPPPLDPPPILRLYHDDSDSRGRWKLRQLLELWYHPEIMVREKKSSPGTVRFYFEAVGWWEKTTSDPAVEEITRETLKECRDNLRQGRR